MSKLGHDTAFAASDDAQEPGRDAAGHAGRELDAGAGALTALGGVELDVTVVLGGASLPLSEVLELRDGAVISLDRRASDLVDITVGGRTVARGELVMVDDDLAVRVVEVAPAEGEDT